MRRRVPPATAVYSPVMVVTRTSVAERFVRPPGPFLDGRWLVPRFTRRDAEALVRMGIVPEDASTELLNGQIVLKDRAALGQDPTTIGPGHVKSTEKLSNLRTQINGPTRHVRSQQPLVCGDTHQPEPDFMIVGGTLDEGADLPTAADALCVLEVADASYDRDTGEKLEPYARAGVVQYVVLNLRNRTAEVYADPDRTLGTYPPPRVVTAGGVLMLNVGEGGRFSVRIRDMLPE